MECCNNKMLNILKVAGLFQSVVYLNSLSDISPTSQQIESRHTNMMSDLFTGRSSKNQGSKKEENENGVSKKEGKEADRKGNNKRDDNDDNNSGGMLEPIF